MRARGVAGTIGRSGSSSSNNGNSNSSNGRRQKRREVVDDGGGRVEGARGEKERGEVKVEVQREAGREERRTRERERGRDDGPRSAGCMTLPRGPFLPWGPRGRQDALKITP